MKVIDSRVRQPSGYLSVMRIGRDRRRRVKDPSGNELVTQLPFHAICRGRATTGHGAAQNRKHTPVMASFPPAESAWWGGLLDGEFCCHHCSSFRSTGISVESGVRPSCASSACPPATPSPVQKQASRHETQTGIEPATGIFGRRCSSSATECLGQPTISGDALCASNRPGRTGSRLAPGSTRRRPGARSCLVWISAWPAAPLAPGGDGLRAVVRPDCGTAPWLLALADIWLSQPLPVASQATSPKPPWAWLPAGGADFWKAS